MHGISRHNLFLNYEKKSFSRCHYFSFPFYRNVFFSPARPSSPSHFNNKFCFADFIFQHNTSGILIIFGRENVPSKKEMWHYGNPCYTLFTCHASDVFQFSIHSNISYFLIATFKFILDAFHALYYIASRFRGSFYLFRVIQSSCFPGGPLVR